MSLGGDLAAMDAGTRRFACTQCGKCCNRSPEVELSEAAGLADTFVFRLMFRLYRQSRSPERGSNDDARAFYEKKRLLSAHAARAYPGKATRDGKTVEHVNYLMISALAIDVRPGACAALSSSRCSIYDRRPLTCRTVPLHYSRGEAAAYRDFDTFVRTPGYRCDVSASAPILLDAGGIAAAGMREARAQALAMAKCDLPWKQAIVRAMKSADQSALPSLRDIGTNAPFGAMTTSMRIAWQIGARAALFTQADVRTLVTVQLATIERELEMSLASLEDRQTLEEMRAEYLEALTG